MTDQNEICPICHDTIEITTHGVLAAYTLPECGHMYHTECAVNWFRVSPRCPMCNDTGVAHHATVTPYLAVKSAYASASTTARKKTASLELKRQYEKISKLNAAMKTLTATKTEIMGETGVYREIRKRYSSTQRKLWSTRRKLWCEKKTLVHMCPKPINVIIPHRVNVGTAVSAAPVALPPPSPDSDGQESTDDGYAQDNHMIA